MHIVRVPRAGEPRLPLPTATRRVLGRAPATSDPAPGTEGLPEGGGIRRVGPQDWFWQVHSTDVAEAAPRRWQLALDSLRPRRARGEAIVSDRLVARIVAAHGTRVSQAAERHTISAALLTAVIAVESAGRSRAVSSAGAQGLMQLIPATAARFGVTNSFDPDQNVRGGAAYLSWLLNRFSQDPILALAGYNAGEGAVDKHAGVPPYRETRDYVVKVFDALAAVERYCERPPASPRHPCDWRGGSGTAAAALSQ